jgi:methylmalonyl-CoA mutase
MTDKPTIDQWAAAADKEVKGKDLTHIAFMVHH